MMDIILEREITIGMDNRVKFELLLSRLSSSRDSKVSSGG